MIEIPRNIVGLQRAALIGYGIFITTNDLSPTITIQCGNTSNFIIKIKDKQ